MNSPRILITRSPHQASELADHLRALGAEPILIPTIETVDPTSFVPIDAAIASLQTFHWLLFTSANSVEAFHKRVIQADALKGTGFSPFVKFPNKQGAIDPGVRLPSNLKIAAIGPASVRALESIGLPTDLIPQKAIAESLAGALLPHALQPDGSATRFLLIRAEEAREHLPETLRAAGANVTIVPAYRTVTPPGSLDAIRDLFRNAATMPDAVTFTSSSTARNLVELLTAAGVPLSKRVIRASIGPITSQTLRELDYPPHLESETASMESLAEATVSYLHARSHEPRMANE